MDAGHRRLNGPVYDMRTPHQRTRDLSDQEIFDACCSRDDSRDGIDCPAAILLPRKCGQQVARTKGCNLSTQTARRRGGWRHCSQCFSISGVASVLGTSNSYTVGGSSILSGDVNLGDESADAIAITGDATFSNGIIMSGDVTHGGA